MHVNSYIEPAPVLVELPRIHQLEVVERLEHFGELRAALHGELGLAVLGGRGHVTGASEEARRRKRGVVRKCSKWK